MKIALIGMSGMGKSYWSKRLEQEAGFSRISIDEEIQAELRTRYHDPALSAQEGLAGWMKNPWDPGHGDREREYLESEERTTRAAIERITQSAGSWVLDTSGSVIYLSPALHAEMRKVCKIVFLEHSPEQEDALYRTLLKHPKPLIWGGRYSQQAGESPEDARSRCFRELLRSRTSMYIELAERRVKMKEIRHSNPGIKNFVSLLGGE